MKNRTKTKLCDGRYELACTDLYEPQNATMFEPLPNLAAEIQKQLQRPIHFPSIDRALVPGDSIAIALKPDVPHLAELVGGLLNALRQCGVDVEKNVTLVVSGDIGCKTTEIGALKTSQHFPDDQASLAYLMAAQSGQPVYVNRCLFDADVVIPIAACCGVRTADAICPAFCDRATADSLLNLPEHEARHLIESINDWLGVFWEIQIVAGPNHAVCQILAGDRKHVSELAAAASKKIWHLSLDRPAEMVVATLESEADQSWENARQAILNADLAATEHGVIVLCSRLARDPQESWLDAAESDANLDLLADVFRRRHVYLIGQVTRTVSEKIGFGHIQSTAELNRLADQHSSCCLLRDAHNMSLQIQPDLMARR